MSPASTRLPYEASNCISDTTISMNTTAWSHRYATWDSSTPRIWYITAITGSDSEQTYPIRANAASRRPRTICHGVRLVKLAIFRSGILTSRFRRSITPRPPSSAMSTTAPSVTSIIVSPMSLSSSPRSSISA